MLTLNPHRRAQRVDLNLTGTAHGRQAELTASEDLFRPDRVAVKFQIGDSTPGHRKIVQLRQQAAGVGRTNIRGTVTHRGLVHGLGAIVSGPDQQGAVTYQGQVEKRDMILRETTDEFGDHNVQGRVGSDSVSLRVRTQHGRVDVTGSVGRESISLYGYEYGAAENFPMPGLVSAIAFSAFFNQA